MRFSGLMVFAPEQVGRWYLVPDLEATTSPSIAAASATLSSSRLFSIGVGAKFGAVFTDSLSITELLFSIALTGSVSIIDCRPRPKEATETRIKSVAI